jgi:hypothetical protein
MFCVYSNVAVASAALGGTAEAVSGTSVATSTTTPAINSRSFCTYPSYFVVENAAEAHWSRATNVSKAVLFLPASARPPPSA